MKMPRLWAVVPAAGIGSRMGSDIPKQYLQLGAHCVLEHTLMALSGIDALAGVVVVLAEHDHYWPKLTVSLPCHIFTAIGGAERADSVLNALDVLQAHAADDDWILVHDAARPCVRREDLNRLISVVGNDPVGGLLAMPVRDTMKQASTDQHSVSTLDRSRLWHALTPQMFRLGALQSALRAARAAGVAVTDDASAMEHAGFQPRLVEGHADNLKITRPEDLLVAELYLRQQHRLQERL